MIVSFGSAVAFKFLLSMVLLGPLGLFCQKLINQQRITDALIVIVFLILEVGLVCSIYLEIKKKIE